MRQLRGDLTKKYSGVALIFGATSAIGLAVTRKYLNSDYRVIGVGHENLAALRDEMSKEKRLIAHRCNFASERSLQGLINKLPLPDITAFVNLSAYTRKCGLAGSSVSELKGAICVSAITNYYTLGSLLPWFINARRGRIVIGSSIGVQYGGAPANFLYSWSLHAREFIPAEALDAAKNNVLINVIRIGVTDTPQLRRRKKDLGERIKLIPAGRMAHPEEIANVITWLGSEANSFVTGQVIAAAGGE